MRTLLTVAIVVAVSALAGAQDRLAEQLRKGIVQEEVNQDLAKAIEAYQAIVTQFDSDRKTAAAALFRLAECSRKAGRRDQAIAAYQRVVREFPDQASLVEPSRRQLATTFGIADPRPDPTPRPSSRAAGQSRERVPETLQREMASAEERLAAYEQRVNAGLVSRESAEYQKLRQELEQVRRQVEVAHSNDTPRGRTRAPLERPMGSLEATRIEIEAMGAQLTEQQKRVEQGLATHSEVREIQKQYQLLQQRYQEQLKEREAKADEERAAQLLAQQIIKSVEAETLLVQERIASIEKRINVGAAPKDDPELLQLRRDLLGLQRKLDELRVGVRR